MLGISNTSNLMELYEAYDQEAQKINDSSAFNRAIVSHPSGLDVLFAPNRLEQHGYFDMGFVETVIKNIQLKQDYDIVVFDTTNEINETTLKIIEMVKNILLVGTQEICTVKDTERVLQLFKELDIPMKKISLLLNKTSHDSMIEIKEIPNYLGIPIKATIPYDYKTAISSINQGKPVVSGEPNDVMRSLLGIAKLSNVCPDLKDVKIPKKKKGFFQKLFGGSSKKKKKKVKKKRKKKPKKTKKVRKKK
jgi:Flp pilus assembly CpaE family ATPase